MEIPMDKDQRLSFYDKHLAQITSHTAVFAVSDYYAVELQLFLQKNGISIPDDISVAGFDGTSLCMQVNPTLTSVSQDNAYRARIALEQLGKMRRNPDYKSDIILPVELKPAGSTGRAKEIS